MISVVGNKIINEQKHITALFSSDFNNDKYLGLLPDGWYKKRSIADTTKYAYLYIMTHDSGRRSVTVLSGDGKLFPATDSSNPSLFTTWEYCPDLKVQIQIETT